MTDIVLITVDALRADHISYLGYDRETTPLLDDRLNDWMIYTNAFAHGPTTFTSFPSILTGQHAYSNPEFPLLKGQTIAEYLRNVGYHTLMATSNVWISPTYEYDRGFEEVHALGQGPRAATNWRERTRHRIGNILGEGIMFRTLKKVYDYVREVDETNEEESLYKLASEHVARSQPTFTWVHYMTTHAPYTVDAESNAPFVDEIPKENEQKDLIEAARRHPDRISKADRRLLHDLYDASIRNVDRRINELLTDIDLDETFVCITADHGEGFWEHGYFEHPPQLHNELLHVPLFIKSPQKETTQITKPVGLNRISPTIASHAGIKKGGEALPPWNKNNNPIRSAVAHPSRFEPEKIAKEYLKVSLIDEGWKLIWKEGEESNLYDLSTDKGEANDISDNYESVVSRLESQAEQFADKLQFGKEANIPNELEEKLSDLGYLE